MMEGVGRRLGSGRSGHLLDIGSHSLNGRERNVLFRNNADETFSEVGWVNAADRVEDGRGLAVFDYDDNGSLDLVLRNYRMQTVLLANRGGAGHWVRFELIGTSSNRDAVGAKARLRSGEHSQTRVVTTGSGYLSGSSRRLHFGLGETNRIDEIAIEWPSGAHTVLTDLEVDRMYTIREGSEFAVLERGTQPPEIHKNSTDRPFLSPALQGTANSKSTHQTGP